MYLFNVCVMSMLTAHLIAPRKLNNSKSGYSTSPVEGNTAKVHWPVPYKHSLNIYCLSCFKEDWKGWVQSRQLEAIMNNVVMCAIRERQGKWPCIMQHMYPSKIKP